MAEAKGNENLMSAVAYLGWWITGIIFLLVEKQSKLVRFHAAQSVVVFGLFSVLVMIPMIGWILSPIIMFVAFIIWLVLMWKGFQGEHFKVPLAGDWAEKLLDKLGK